MREMGLATRVSAAFTPTTTKSDPTKQAASNLLDRDFTAEKPEVGDGYHLPAHGGRLGLLGRGGRLVQL
jgi:hypothetical protein